MRRLRLALGDEMGIGGRRHACALVVAGDKVDAVATAAGAVQVGTCGGRAILRRTVGVAKAPLVTADDGCLALGLQDRIDQSTGIVVGVLPARCQHILLFDGKIQRRRQRAPGRVARATLGDGGPLGRERQVGGGSRSRIGVGHIDISGVGDLGEQATLFIRDGGQLGAVGRDGPQVARALVECVLDVEGRTVGVGEASHAPNHGPLGIDGEVGDHAPRVGVRDDLLKDVAHRSRGEGPGGRRCRGNCCEDAVAPLACDRGRGQDGAVETGDRG